MRTKTLLFLLLLSCGVLNAQDTIRTLIISEVRLDDARHAYIEITNVGTTTLSLSQFELGIIGPWTVPWAAPANSWFMLPDKQLEPGKSIVAASVYDWNPRMWLTQPETHNRILNKKEFWSLADIKLHQKESPTNDPTDSITPYYGILGIYGGRDCLYIRHHISATDSVVVDQVGGIFDESDGTGIDGAHDVAGVTNATSESTLIRKFKIKKGNIDFESGRGQDMEESEWMPIPLQLGHWEMDRRLFWTVGNHGDYNLDATTLVSSVADINWADSTITVPWGVRNDDSIMSLMEKKPGLAWHYSYAKTREDSNFISARTGDILTVYACGNDLDMVNFKIHVAPATADANIVVPKRVMNGETGFFANDDGTPTGPMYMVSDKVPGMDTIQAASYRGIGFATRVDTLFKYLEKAPLANWEIVWVDGNVRTDLKNGDILKVTAEDGSVKEYFIKVDGYRPSHNAFLSSITWPDIPEDYRGIFGWAGDTIPNFLPRTNYNYKVNIPSKSMPALVGKMDDVDAKLQIIRAVNLTGSAEDRTVTFNTTAEDDTSKLTYKVELVREKDTVDIQKWKGEPFISQLVFWEQWSNGFVEIVNPRPVPLDLSDYMIYGQWAGSPADAITSYSAAEDWPNRYVKYIPGYKWQDETNWAIEPYIAVQDLNILPIVQPGDVFVLGDVRTTAFSGYPWFVSKQLDIDFSHNPWNETYDGEDCARQWTGANIFIFKILNDSIKQGLKPANDPNDFQLVETFGNGAGVNWVIGGRTSDMINGWVRKPEIYKGNIDFNGSFGTNEENSEWIQTDQAYYDARNAGWPDDILLVADGLGSHFMNEVLFYKSTVKSNVYNVSDGYKTPQSIRGVITDTTVAGFLANIIKADTGQALTLKSALSGEILTATDTLMNGDTLIVVSQDLTNTTKYILTVNNEGLSNDALLTSTEYSIIVDGEEGTVSGFDYGTLLKDVVSKVHVPANASFSVIDAAGMYVPLKTLNFDTAYVDVQVNDKMLFEVVAENGTDKIAYRLVPNSTASDAFVTSSVFMVYQESALIDLVPDGTSTPAFLSNLVPATGATMQLIDKLGYDRIFGTVVKDDKLVVTAADGETTKTYYLQMLGNLSQAYVLSEVYLVNQDAYSISGEFTEETEVSEFIANLILAPGASVKVTDADHVENTGTLKKGDLLVVTAADGVTEVTYGIEFPTSVNDPDRSAVTIYPNPTSDRFTVKGLEHGDRIRINNILGVLILDRTAQQDMEVIPMAGQRSGVYFVTVSNNDKIIGRYKLVLK